VARVIACGEVALSASSIGTSRQVGVETSKKKNKINHDTCMTLVNNLHSSLSISGFISKAVSRKYMVKNVAIKEVSFD